MGKRKTTEEFILEAKLIHKDKYNYSKVEYTKAHDKICIICPEHGEFWQEAHHHLKGSGCPKCGRKRDPDKLKEDFIRKANEIHNNKYDYSKINYVNSQTKIEIVCPEHGSFWQVPNSHLLGIGCPKCANNQRKSNNLFIEEANKIHNNKYDYSKVIYVNNHTLVNIICPIHGEFKQIPSDHLQGRGCLKCGILSRILKRSSNNSEFINKAKQIHGSKYDYSKVEYVNNHTKVCIVCPEHGEFWLTPHNHIVGKTGCPICNKSHGELFLENYFMRNNIKYQSLYKINIPKDIRKSGVAYIDFYLPDYNIFIEYNGELHYKPSRFSNGLVLFELQQKRDVYVREYATNNNIELIEIPYTVDNLEECLNYIFNNMDNIKIVKQTLYTQWVDQSTGELFEETREFLDDTIKVPKKTSSRSSKKPKDDDTEPKVYLEDNKIRLNSKAVELMEFEPEQKINILFEKKGRTTTPVLCEDEKSGNRLTKTFTVSCRGSKHDNLAEYGDVFEIIPYEGKDGYFKLKGNIEKEDDIVDVPEEIVNPEEFDDDINDESGVDIGDFDLEL